MNNLTLLHLSDLHAREKEIAEFRIRRDALLKDLRQLQTKPDIVLISGDIAFSAEKSQYQIAREEFLCPLMENLNINRGNLIISPGNHDISRSLIAPLIADGISSRLSDTEAAQSLLGHKDWILPQQSEYMTFLQSIQEKETIRFPFFSKILRKNMISVGVSAFDSAWLCINDDTNKRIFLTRQQVQEQADQIRDADLKIALIHHPLTWFHPSEHEIVQQDLRACFDLILTGHMHEAASFGTITPSTDCLEITAGSFFAGAPRYTKDGYNLYTINPKEGTLHARFRAFIRSRKSYDHNVEHAEGGEFCFYLPSTAFATQVNFSLVKRVTDASTELGVKMSESLKRVQNLDPPILLTPPAQQMTWEKTGRKYSPLRDPYKFCSDNVCLLYSPPDAGSTVFLQDLCQRLNRQDRTAFYVIFSELQHVKTAEQMLRKLSKKYGLKEDELRNGNCNYSAKSS